MTAEELWPPGYDATTQNAAEAALARQRMIWFARDGLVRAKYAREHGHLQTSYDHDGFFDQLEFASLHIRRAIYFTSQLHAFRDREQPTRKPGEQLNFVFDA